MLLRLAVLAAVVACATGRTAPRDDAKPDCLKAGDGYYVAGCSAKFWRCVNDRLYSYDCPKGLYFNPIKRKCEYKADVPICMNGVKVDTRNVIKASAEFNCTDLPDGPYKPRDIACSNTFITCFNGMAVEQACPFGQFFHEKNSACDYKDNVPGCIQSGSKIGGSIGATCTPLRSGHVDIPCDTDEVCQKIDAPVDGRYLCPAPFMVYYGPLGSDTSRQWTMAADGLRCGEDGHWYDGNRVVTTPAVDCTAKRSDLSGQDRSYGSAPAPPQRDATSVNAKAAALNACPGLRTSKDTKEIPCDANEVCQEIKRPKNGRYSCEAPFTVWYGPVNGKTDEWRKAKEALVCGADGFWYDSGVKVSTNGIDCTAPKSAFEKKEEKDETSGCPSLSTNEREIPCKGDEEICQPILKAVAGKYACPTPYRVWYGPRDQPESAWKQAKDALICKSGAWFDGDVKIDATAVDCTVKKIDCSKLGDGAYNGEPGRCSTHFWQCSNEQAYLYPCAPGLFFDDFSKNCDYKEVIESCGGVRREPSAATTTTAAPIVADAPKKTDCPTILTDSSLPCKSGEACVAPADPVNQKYLCDTPYTLWFGPKNNADQWRQAPNGIQCKDGRWFNGEEQIAPEAVHCTTPKFDCSGKKDGSYSAHPEKCTAYFWNCAHDDAFLYTCPAGLFFDVDSLSCDYKEVNVACGGMKKDTTAAPKELIPASDAVDPAFSCAGKDNGYHEDGKCHKKFWNCADGKSFQIDCPEGLVYDGRVELCQYPAACDADLPVTTTPAVPPSTLDHGDISQKPAVPTTSFDCSSQADGLYAEKKCHKQYVECSNGRTFAKECPAGLVFAAFKKMCDYKQVCMNPPTTTAAPTTTTAAPAADAGSAAYATYERTPVTTTTTQAPIAPPNFDLPNCANLEDGAHAMARCGQEFFMCWQGVASASKCNDGLIFNPHSAQCDYRSNVIECGAAADTAVTTTAAPGMPAPPPPSTTAAPDLFCEGREDGHYGSGCQSYFYSCQNGATTKMFCPVGLHYDADSKTCDMREIIVACGGKKESTTTPAAAPATGYATMKPYAPVKDVPIPPSDNFCTGKTDGFYAVGCQDFFYSCHDGKTYKMTCPTSLFYDFDQKACNRKEEIVACGATPTTKAPITPAAAPTAEYISVPTAVPVRDIPIAPIDNFCAGKTDGFYALECENFFYSCQNGKSYKMNCPTNLFYDSVKKMCNLREEIVACGATPSTTPAAAPASSYLPMNVAPAVKDVPVVALDKFCIGKEDAFYGNGCQTHFYSCQNGVAYKMDCPSTLYYDADQKKCDRKEEIVACGATPTTQAPTTPAAAPAASYARPAAPVKDVPVVSVEKFCIGKEDAFYGNGCQTYFYSCQNGVAHKMDCPSTLFYDADQKKCDRREEIVACGATPTTQAPIPKAADVPAIPIESYCDGKKDGFYTLGCASFFYSCQNGATYKMTCPSGLYYDVAQKMCLNKEEIVACGAPPATTPAAAPATTATTAAPAPYSVRPADVPVAVAENVCAGKTNVVIGAGCQNIFYNCVEGVSYKTTCQDGLFFDADIKSCNYKELIVACGGKKPEATVAPITPALDRPAVAVENFCLAKEDGFYAVGCATFFYSCQAGATYKMNCPSGLYYDQKNNHCDAKEDVIECGNALTSTPSIALAPVSPSYTVTPVTPSTPVRDIIPLITNENFCAGKNDGFYGQGCLDHFFSCSNGLTAKMMCPSGLFYDVVRKQCDNREDIVACGGVAPVAPVAPAAAPAQPVAPSPYVQPVQPAATAAPVRDVVPVVSQDKFCAGKADGLYSEGCQSFYYSCLSGLTYKMACPSNLFYDVPSNLCDVRENVVACGGKKPLIPVAPLAQAPSTPVVADQFCAGKVDGFYGLQCEGFFYSCNNGYTVKMHCPSGLFYDVTTKACNNREKVTACGAAPAAPAAPIAPAAAVPQYSVPAPPPVVPAAAPALPVIPTTPFSCSGKANGIYTVGCANFYYECSNGYTSKMACPAGLFFDVTKKTCELKETVVACGGQQPLKPQILPATAAPVRDVITPVNNFCSGKIDGIYTEGCANFYYHCANGYTTKMACPAGLFFDVSKKTCELKETVVACGAQQTPQTQPQTVHQPATPAPVRDVVAPTTNFCSGKTDGIYTEGCANFYFQCSNGYTTKMACPSGLFFDISKQTCELKETVVACGGQQPQLAQPQILPQQPQTQYQPAPATAAPVRDVVAPTKNFCSGKIDGIYTEGCANFYYHCSNGFTTKMACPAGLFFDVSKKTCELKETVVVCGAQQTPQTQPQTVHQPATPAPVRDVVAPVNNFCSGKTDGIYTEGCANFYFQCSNGYTTKMACPSGLFFDISKKTCELKENVVACGGQQPQLAQPQILPQQPQTQYQPTPATAAPVRDVIAPTNNFCSGKIDGIYTEGCANFYFHCSNGYTTKMACPSGLFFDVSKKTCELKESVVACGGQQPQLSQPQTQHQPATPAPVRDVAAPATNFCSGKANGIYAEGCANFYYHCSNGYTTKMACPSGLVFDVSKKTCELKESVVACGGQQPQLAQPQTYQPAPTVAPVRDATAPVTNFCSGKADGIYTEGCANFYFHCSNGYTTKMACPAGLFFDLSKKTCELKETVAACGAQQPQQTQPKIEYQPATAAPVRDVVTPANNFCSGKVDGIYSEGCANFYFHCSNGYTTKMACPAGLFFDVTNKACEVKETVIACGAQQPQLAQIQTFQPATAAPVRDVVVPTTNFCSGKVDGIYSEGCADFYHQCSNGYTTKMACPSGLFFDISKKTCELKESIAACGGQQPQLTQPQILPHPQTGYQPAPATAAPVRDVVAPTTHFCSGKADGIYTEGCSTFYYNCQNGYTHKMGCPSGLFYNVPSKSCELKENVVACGGQPQQAQPQTQTAPATSSPARDSIVIPALSTFCKGREDGTYGDGCNNFFYYCTGGNTHKMDCAPALFFSVTSKQCEYRDKVVACGGVAAAPAATAAPASPGYTQPAATAAPTTSRPAAAAKDTTSTVTDKSCAGKENSFFGEGCNAFFHSCINGAAYKMACPTGLFYDLELQSCEYKDNVPNCGGRRVEVAATPSPALDNLPPAPLNNQLCNGKKDGFYAVADCSQEFFSCHSGLVQKEACRDTLIYNEANGMCDWRENVAKCGARDTLPTRAPTTAPSTEYGRTPSRLPSRPAQKPDSHKKEQQKTKKPVFAPSGTSCAAKDDGYYANGCSSDYTACAAGQTMTMSCPSDLRYSESTQMCDYADNVPECGGSTPVRDAPVVAPRPTVSPVAPVAPVQPVLQPAPTKAPVKEVHPRCAGRPDGIYALAPCSQNYLACVDEKATIGRCRDDLFYSTTSGLCDWKDTIPACTMMVRPTPIIPRSTPTTTPIPTVPSSDVARPSGGRLNRPTVPLGLHPDCTQIADGLYAFNACSPYYNRCKNGRHFSRGTCPTGTVFSATEGSCVDKKTVSACISPLPTAAPTQAPALAPVAQPNYGVQPVQQQQPVYQQQQQMTYQQPQQSYTQQYAPSYSANYASDIYADPSQFCYNRPDGIYGNTCQKSYMICTRGATLSYSCNHDFVFDRMRAVCDSPTRIPQCAPPPVYGYAPAQPSYGYSAPSYQQQQSYSQY